MDKKPQRKDFESDVAFMLEKKAWDRKQARAGAAERAAKAAREKVARDAKIQTLVAGGTTVADLIAVLQKCPPDMRVALAGCDCYVAWEGQVTVDANEDVNCIALER